MSVPTREHDRGHARNLDPVHALPETLEQRVARAMPALNGDVSQRSWPTRVNRGVDLGFGFEFLRARPFEGAIRHHEVAGVRTFSVVCEPHTVYREAQHLDERGDAYFLLTLQVSGTKTVVQGSDRAAISAGEFTVYDSEQPVALNVTREYRSFNVRIPKPLISAERQRLFEDLRCQPLVTNGGLADFVWSAMIGIDGLAASPGPYSVEASRHTVELASLMLLESANVLSGHGGEPVADDRLQRLEVAKSYMGRHLGDTDLTLERVAAETYMSARTLHNLFTGTGETAWSWLRSRRIEAAKQQLRNPVGGSIASIAVRCGFSSVSHFTQAFKQVVGMTPSQYRAQHAN
ncbi:MAG: helix-turn-helix domain-containing protein [Pseudoclavibacter sp.]